MAKKLEVIIREHVPAIAKAIRAEGYKTKVERSKKQTVSVFGKGDFINILRNPERFKKLKDGWIRDALLGLDWGPSSTERMTWEEAKKYCADKGGRLPEITELHSLVDYSKRNPAINPIFSDTKADDWYWSDTQVAGRSGLAWGVDFGGGYVNFWSKDVSYYVRPCRSSKD